MPTPEAAATERPGPTFELPDVVTDLDMPHLRQFASMLRFAPLDGRIWMNERRMVLLHGEAFASLRNELIASLGLDMARGLLTRIGYAAGCRDAELAWKARPDTTLTELIGSGSALHGLMGFVRVERLRDRSSARDATEDLHFEWVWHDCIEDEVHVASHGVGAHAACWNEVGYSSGYLSTCAGRRILVREMACRALGNDHCHSIAKPVSAWGEEAAEDLRFLEPQAPPVRSHGGFRPPEAAHPAIGSEESRPSARRHAGGAAPSGGLAGASAAFHLLRHHMLRVAPTHATVLVLGESGVGKSAVAREIHRQSTRARSAFVEINCAAIPESLIESELFGVERGAFSGATHARPGRFEIADGGTLFLDEIGTLSLTAQGKLLRVLQTGELERLGSNRTLATDVRVIAATNDNLVAAVREGRFREDLYFRLNVFPLHVPPLRERRDDIPLLTEVFLERFARRHGRQPTGVTPRAMQMLLQQPWPGNIRELENVLERGLILAADGERIDLYHLRSIGPDALGTALSELEALPRHDSGPGLSLDWERIVDQHLAAGPLDLASIEDAAVRAALSRADGNVSRAARLLGMTRAQLDYRVKKLSR